MKVSSQVINDSGSNDHSPSTLIPIEAEGFHAFAMAGVQTSNNRDQSFPEPEPEPAPEPGLF